jgi:hypothetical protein
MTTAALAGTLQRVIPWSERRVLLQWATAAIAFAILYGGPIAKLARDWWVEPDAGHGLLLAPLALYLAWKRGVRADARGQRILGSVLLGIAVIMRYVGGLAAELFTMRASLVSASSG